MVSYLSGLISGAGDNLGRLTILIKSDSCIKTGSTASSDGKISRWLNFSKFAAVFSMLLENMIINYGKINAINFFNRLRNLIP